MPDSTRRQSAAKSRSGHSTTGKQPSHKKPKFPLWLHPTGQWAKRIKSKFHYFGKDREAALKEYLRVKEDLEAGRQPPPADDQRTSIKTLVNTFLTFKQSQCRLGELTQTSFNDYRSSSEAFAEFFGKDRAVESLRPEDLLRYRQDISKGGKSPHTVGGEVQRVRVMLRFAFESGLIATPIRFGEFKRPKKAAFRRQKQLVGSRLFSREELHQILGEADPQLKAMILLGLNCGFGNSDCGQLPLSAVDLGGGWIDYPRPKTGIERRSKLWPETRDAIGGWLSIRKKPIEEYEHLVFTTKKGNAWHRDGEPGSPLSAEFRKLLNRLKLYRRGMSFYSLRHVFRTVADGCRDQVAINLVMGHADGHMAATYRDRIEDDRLEAVANHVRAWLFGSEGGGA